MAPFFHAELIHHVPSYAITNQTVQSAISVNGSDAITRTYQLNGNTFRMMGETINPEAAQLSATPADGASWYAYDWSYGFMA